MKMKSLEDYTWDQLHSFRYENYPYRMVVVSPLSYEEVKEDFNEYISELTNLAAQCNDCVVSKDECKQCNPYNKRFETFLSEKRGVPAISAIFEDESPIGRKNELFAQIATMTDRVKLYTAMLL